MTPLFANNFVLHNLMPSKENLIKASDEYTCITLKSSRAVQLASISFQVQKLYDVCLCIIVSYNASHKSTIVWASPKAPSSTTSFLHNAQIIA